MNNEKGVASMNLDIQDPRSERSSEERDLQLLVSRISQGDEDAMRVFYDMTVRLVYGLSYRIVSNSEDAEEVALEVYLYVWKNACQYDPELSKPLTWLFMLTRSRAIDKVRKSAKSVQIDDNIDESSITENENPEASHIAYETRKIIKYAMSQLSSKQKEVIELSYYYQYSHSEIAQRVGIPVGSVKSTIRLAMVKLKNIIKKEKEPINETIVYRQRDSGFSGFLRHGFIE